MTFNHFIKRHTKLVLIFIAALMVIPLVLMGSFGQEMGDPDADKVAGTFVNALGETVTVSVQEYRRARTRALPDYWWQQLLKNPFGFFRNREQPKEHELHRIAWDRLILIEDARVNNITVSRSEYLQTINQVFNFVTRFQGRVQFSEPALYGIGERFFNARKPTFDAWLQEFAVTEKLLTLVSEGAFAEYGKVYEEVTREGREARVWYAGFDPENYRAEVRRIGAEEIAARYERNQAQYRVGEKIRVSYLMAELEKLKAKVPEPTEEQIKTHYNEIKDEFLKPHEHAPGEAHREDEEPPGHKPLEEVRDEVAEKWKTRQAQDQAYAIMSEVSRALGNDKYKDPETKKIKDDAFGELQADFAGKGELVLDLTSPFGRLDLAEVEKTIGENSNLAVWGFDAQAQVGKISDGPVVTSKGVLLFRLQEKKAPYSPGVTEPIRQRIETELRREQLLKRAETAAKSLEKSLNARGLAEARSGADWSRSGYFKVNGGQTGIEDYSLSSEITRRIQADQLKSGRAATVAGGRSTPEKEGWSYVVFLEDVRPGEPEDFQTAFNTARSRLDREEQGRYREQYARNVRATSELKDVLATEKPSLAPPDTGPGTAPPTP